ncbi:MFS transporter [Anaerosinus massiliensis]|uniref:MFS transporter n=1 Tax=Massilibacillus massiliensis TaxID=1806837 RepID=UPI000AEA1152|nr:MFS transporter [Massilibacillus massiliensis]
MQTKRSQSIIVISFITASCLIGDSMLYVVLPTHWKDMGLDSLWQVGIILSVNRLVRLPLNPFVSYLYKKLSARTGILIAIFLTVLTTSSYGIISNFLLFILVRCLWGLAWTFLRLGAYFTILDIATDLNRGKLMGLYNGLYRLGSLFGMLLGGFLSDIIGVRSTALWFAALSACCIPVVFFCVKKSSKGMIAEAAKKEVQFSFFKNLDILSILCVGMLIAMIYQGMFTSTLSYLIEIHNTSAISWGSFLIGAASLGGVVQAIRWLWEPFLAPKIGSLTDGIHGRYPLFLVSTGIASILFAVIPFQLPTLLWFFFIMILQITATSLTTIADALAADAATNSAKVKVMTLYSLLIDFGAALGPMLAYFANQYIHPYASYWGASFLLFAITLIYATKIKQPT